MSEKDMIIELLEIAEVAKDGTVEFSDRAKEIIKELSEKYEQTAVYKQAQAEKPDWVKETSAAGIYIQMCDRIINAPSTIHMMIAPKILLPILWEKIQAEDTAAEGKTEG